MSAVRPQTIKIFLPDGNPTSIKIVDLTNRLISAVLIPRNKLNDVSARNEVRKHGVYFLFGINEEKAKPIAYIGETEDCFERLKEHNNKKDFWNYAVVFSHKANEFTKSHVKYLEYLCVDNAKGIGRFEIENSNNPSRAHISESMEADLLDNFDTIKILLSTLGFPIFEEIKKSLVSEKEILYCKGKDASAEGDLIDDGFVVFKGSTANKGETKTIGLSALNRRKSLLENNILKDNGINYIFNEDYVFTSPSAAADAVLGRSANGWTEWKNKDGKTIDELYRKVLIDTSN